VLALLATYFARFLDGLIEHLRAPPVGKVHQ
jgi:hypothetical protein